MRDDEALALEPLQNILVHLLNSEISAETKMILNKWANLSVYYYILAGWIFLIDNNQYSIDWLSTILSY